MKKEYAKLTNEFLKKNLNQRKKRLDSWKELKIKKIKKLVENKEKWYKSFDDKKIEKIENTRRKKVKEYSDKLMDALNKQYKDIWYRKLRKFKDLKENLDLSDFVLDKAKLIDKSIKLDNIIFNAKQDLENVKKGTKKYKKLEKEIKQAEEKLEELKK